MLQMPLHSGLLTGVEALYSGFNSGGLRKSFHPTNTQNHERLLTERSSVAHGAVRK